MAENSSGEGRHGLLIILGIILIAWFVRSQGGLLTLVGQENGSTNAPETREERVQSIGRQVEDLEDDVSDYIESRSTSPYADQVVLRTGGARRDEPQEEYIEINARRLSTSVSITGWKLVNVTKDRIITIGRYPRVAYPFQRNQSEEVVVLAPDEQVYVFTGFSPIQTSFKENICTGYFENTNDFGKSLSRSCPDADDEDVLEDLDLDDNDDCVDFVGRIGRCEDYRGLPSDDEGLSRSCIEYIDEQLTYEGCVDLFEDRTDFDGDAWHIYANLFYTSELWEDDDLVLLIDASGQQVDTLSI